MPSLNTHQLVADLASGNEQRKAAAIHVIVALTPATDVDEGIFIEALKSANPDVTHWAAVALKLLGPRGLAAIPALVALLGREQLFLRQAAVRALAAVGPHDRLARAAVFDLFGDESPFIRREALTASLTLPDLDEEDLAAIAAMATDPDEAVAAMGLRSIRS
ncbi:MAG TPA: HEAT repeat domain-containing protein [Lacunisphaera sp.]